MKDSIQLITNDMNSAVAAQQAGDYRAALRHAESAWMRVCVLPDSEFENERLEWSRDGIGELLKYLKQRVGEADGQSRGSLIQSQDVHYRRG